MTRIANDPADFAHEALDGFVAAHRRWVRPAPGGVVRAGGTAPGQVAVVIGGGSGHYPAFSGLVGQGLAHGAAVGNVFASPSARQIHDVAAEADNGAGVLLAFGNYAGDVLHFGQAAQRLEADGIPARTLAVTDDISSAATDEAHKRRGIAGDLPVFKIASAAAERGAGLDEVHATAVRANDRTRSFGVAFTGCTLPGAEQPLFTVPEGRMAVGLGIHGEPGIGEQDIPDARTLAALLVDKLLDELPQLRGARAAVILNGLGTVKYEELFVLYGEVSRLLEAAGVEAVDPEVGELCTSFDMAGVSLTLTWLDDELAALWQAPADAPAFRKGAVAPAPVHTKTTARQPVTADTPPPADDASRATAARVLAALAATRATVDTHADELGRIDAVAGDGDHGIGMRRGSHAAHAEAERAVAAGAGAGTTLRLAGDAWADEAGGTSGALWGAMLRALGQTLGDTGRPTSARVAEGVAAADRAVRDLGGAQVGDKTMVDALVPFAATLAAAADDRLAPAWATAATAAEEAARGTADLLPRMGRARPHAEKALGTPDAGAHSFALITRAVANVLAAA
ncbi:dihydroxyacetone kinase family protein [Streptomyces sp. NPDC006422]|uniref:dihydroxyacetone kinase family protein n=1 Tax=unclassified Streptomyces TaxID=2593676 RepID=UPI0033BD9103